MITSEMIVFLEYFALRAYFGSYAFYYVVLIELYIFLCYINHIIHRIKDIKYFNLTKTSICLKELRLIKLIYLEKLIEFI